MEQVCGGPKSALRRELPNHVTLLSLTAEQIDCSLQKKKPRLSAACTPIQYTKTDEGC